MRRAMAYSFEVEAIVLGYHHYKAIWDAQVGEQLQCRRETGNPHDIYVIAILKSGVRVRHFPPKISSICSYAKYWAWLVACGHGTESELIVCG